MANRNTGGTVDTAPAKARSMVDRLNGLQPDIQSKAERYVAGLSEDAMRGVQTPPSAGRSRLSLQNGSLANSRGGTQEMAGTAELAVTGMRRSANAGTSHILDNSQQNTPDWLGRFSGEGNRADAVLDTLTGASPRRESEIAQSHVFEPTVRREDNAPPQHRMGTQVGKLVDAKDTTLGKLVAKIRAEQEAQQV
jgi:hypothetical protein